MPFDLPSGVSLDDLDGPSMRSLSGPSDYEEDIIDYDRNDFDSPSIHIRRCGGDTSPALKGQTAAGKMDSDTPKGTTAENLKETRA